MLPHPSTNDGLLVNQLQPIALFQMQQVLHPQQWSMLPHDNQLPINLRILQLFQQLFVNVQMQNNELSVLILFVKMYSQS